MHDVGLEQLHGRMARRFEPARQAWLNMVERLFRDITVNRLRRGAFNSVPES